MHPSRAIHERKSELLRGRRIVLGIAGSIAAIEVPRIIRELIRHGAEVRAVMSPEATRLVTPEVIAFASGHPPILQLTGEVEHVSLLGPGEGRADLLLLAPATANTISKIAHGIDDTAVTSFASVALGGGVPVLLAPAMHAHMGANPAVRENLERLQRWGVGLVGPLKEEGEEKIASPEEVAAAVLHRLARGPWAGRRVIVVGGAAHEPIDAVRSITNESSGATAAALAVQAHYRGAHTELWAGPMETAIPSFLPLVVRWRSVSDLRRLVADRSESLRDAAAVFVPAALSDFTVRPAPGKVDSGRRARWSLPLQRAPKLLPELRRRVPRPGRLIGFKLLAGAGEATLLSESRALLEEADLDWVVGNDRATMGSARAEWLVVRSTGTVHRLSGAKDAATGKLLDDIGQELQDLSPGARGPASATPRSRGALVRRRGRRRANVGVRSS